MKAYTESRKQDLARELITPNGPSAKGLAQRTHVSQSILSRWVQEATTARGATPKRNDDQREQPQHRVGPVRVTRDFSPSAKHRLVQDSTSLDETAFGAFLRKEGVRCTDLTTWRAQAAEGALGVLTGKRQRTVAQKRPCQLEAELRRKDRPLPETALFVLSKEAGKRPGGQRQGPCQRRHRRCRVQLPHAQAPTAHARRCFDTEQEAADWGPLFVRRHNHEHHHSDIGFVLPADRHEGRDIAPLEQRRAVYEAARFARPERWTRARRAWKPPAEVLLLPNTQALKLDPVTARVG